MSEHRKYVRQEKIRKDKQQMKLGETGKINTSTSAHIEPKITVNFNEEVACPFCLYAAKLSAFLIVGKDGYQQGKAHCPECKNNMMMKSLYNEWTAKDYADWVFNYRLSGFWSKCPFAKWKERLYKMGWAGAFWTRYKDLKGTSTTNRFFEDAEKTAEDYEKLWQEYEGDQK